MFKALEKRIVISFILLFSSILTYGQCSMCKATAENGSDELAEGLNTGILYLMILPYILIGGIVVVILVTLARNRDKAQ